MASLQSDLQAVGLAVGLDIGWKQAGARTVQVMGRATSRSSTASSPAWVSGAGGAAQAWAGGHRADVRVEPRRKASILLRPLGRYGSACLELDGSVTNSSIFGLLCCFTKGSVNKRTCILCAMQCAVQYADCLKQN